MRTATRLLPVLVLAAGTPAPAAEPGPVIRVTASYPGADATAVAGAVGAPFEQQVGGADGVTVMDSESRGDGRYTLVVRFKPGTDAYAAWVLVLNRIALARPQLPAETRRIGIYADPFDPDRLPDLWVAVTGPDPAVLPAVAARTWNAVALTTGVRDWQLVGAPAAGGRAWVERDRLAAAGLTVQDVARALEGQNLSVVTGAFELRLTPTTSNDLPHHHALGGVVVKTRDEGVVRVRDVIRFEPWRSDGEFARVNDKPAALLAARADGGQADAVRKKLAAVDPYAKDVQVDLVADGGRGFTVVELRLPDGASRARTAEAVGRVVKAVRALHGSPDCLAYSGTETSRATVLVKPSGKDGPSPADLRAALAGVKDARIRASDLSAGRPFPVRLALTTDDPGKLRAWADAVAEKLAASGVAPDPDVYPGPDAPLLTVLLDREKADRLGVELSDVLAALPAHPGSVSVYDYAGLGRPVVVTGAADQFRARGDDLKKLAVKAAGGRPVALAAFAEIREVTAPPTVVRVNGHPAVRVTAALPPGKSLADVTATCRKVAEDLAPKGGTVVDLSGAKAR